MLCCNVYRDECFLCVPDVVLEETVPLYLDQVTLGSWGERRVFSSEREKRVEREKEKYRERERDGSWQKKVNEATTYSALPNHGRVVDDENHRVVTGKEALERLLRHAELRAVGARDDARRKQTLVLVQQLRHGLCIWSSTVCVDRKLADLGRAAQKLAEEGAELDIVRSPVGAAEPDHVGLGKALRREQSGGPRIGNGVEKSVVYV